MSFQHYSSKLVLHRIEFFPEFYSIFFKILAYTELFVDTQIIPVVGQHARPLDSVECRRVAMIRISVKKMYNLKSCKRARR